MDAVEARLTRAGLTPEQVQAAMKDTSEEELLGWLDTVHDDDIKERYGDAEAGAEAADGADGADGGSRSPFA